jgi:bifunctional DNA-binding transcriptional regulator/antitoxin component of YhaV-PrlF toxin-antitoxin module
MNKYKVMSMRSTLTITSKGQTTLPTDMRKKLGVPKSGGMLDITYDEQRGQVIITRPLAIDELSDRLTAYVKPQTKPVLNVSEYYQEHQDARI